MKALFQRLTREAKEANPELPAIECRLFFKSGLVLFGVIKPNPDVESEGLYELVVVEPDPSGKTAGVTAKVFFAPEDVAAFAQVEPLRVATMPAGLIIAPPQGRQ